LAGSFNYSTVPTNAPKGSAFQGLTASVTPAGIIRCFSGSTIPSGWLVCDGSTINRMAFSNLFKVIGTTFGAGNSNDTFTLPDMRGRSPIGAGTGASLTARTLGSTLGAETVTLAEANMASHTHTNNSATATQSATHTHTATSGTVSADHTHGWGRNVGSSGSYGIRDGAGRSANGTPNTQGATAGHTHTTTTGTQSATHTHSFSNSYTGTGTPFGIMPPALVFNFIIKT